MNSTKNAFPILNPDNYLNYLDPKAAGQFEVTRNIYLVTLGALLWDILSSVPQDFALLKAGLRPVNIAYFLARSSSLGYVLQSAISKTRANPHCAALGLGVTCCWVVAISSSSFLFLRRVQAVFQDSKPFVYFFSALWVVNVGISFLVPIGSHSGPLSATGYCINIGIKPYVAASAFVPLAFDSLVFLAVSWKIITLHSLAEQETTWGAVFFSGRTLPHFVKAVFRGGQQYYLITVGANILVSVVIIMPSVPSFYKAAFTVPNITLTSSMACRVFRNLRFSLPEDSTTLSALNFKTRSHAEPTTGLSAITSGGISVDTSGARLEPQKSIPRDIEKGKDATPLREAVFTRHPRATHASTGSSGSLET